MRIQTIVRGIEAPDQLAAYAKERLTTALRRHRARIALVTVRLEDINGPRGGVDKSCYVLIEGRFGAIVVRELAEESHLAIARATDRAARNLVRMLERTRRTGAERNAAEWSLA